jgi:Siphovirus Gp157
MSSLRDIVKSVADLETMLIDSGGEINEEISNALVVKETNLPEKVDSYAFFIERMEKVSEFYKEKAEQFLLLSKAANQVIDRLESNIDFAMREMNVEELPGNDMTFKFKKNPPSCNIVDESLIETTYKTIEQIVKIDKRRILEDLKLGVPVSGATLEQKKKVKLVINKKK